MGRRGDIREPGLLNCAWFYQFGSFCGLIWRIRICLRYVLWGEEKVQTKFSMTIFAGKAASGTLLQLMFSFFFAVFVDSSIRHQNTVLHLNYTIRERESAGLAAATGFG